MHQLTLQIYLSQLTLVNFDFSFFNEWLPSVVEFAIKKLPAYIVYKLTVTLNLRPSFASCSVGNTFILITILWMFLF